MARKRKKKIRKMMLVLAFLLLLLASIYLSYTILLYKSIETFIRYAVIGLITSIDILFLLLTIKFLKTKKIIKTFFIIILMIILASGFIYGAYQLKRFYKPISNINKTYITYSSSLITLNSSKINEISDVKNLKIGILDDNSSVEGFIIPDEIIKDNNLKNNNTFLEYEDFLPMINDLYDKKIDALFIKTEFQSQFNSIDKYENIENDTKIIITKNKKMEKQNYIERDKFIDITKPFTMLVLGVDSTTSLGANGDSIMLVTFNPNTLNATILSIPRDTYVPISCRGNREFKINASSWGGEACMEKTITNLTGIKIDYYVLINFTGMVKLVDMLGGVEVDVPIKFCEQNSKRQFGKNEICLNKGLQKLNGEQALALSRHRKTLPTGDLQRGLNQQLVVQAMINKAKDIKDINTIYNILDAISKNMDTNLTTNEILSFYEIIKKIYMNSKDVDSNQFYIQQMYLEGSDARIYDSGSGLSLYNFIYSKDSLNAIIKTMKINLGLIKPEPIKKISFSINKPYEPTIIGKGIKSSNSGIKTLPNFVGKNKQEALTWGNQNGFIITIVEILSTNSSDIEGTILTQDIPAATAINNISNKKITINVIKKNKIDDKDKDNNDDKDDEEETEEDDIDIDILNP